MWGVCVSLKGVCFDEVYYSYYNFFKQMVRVRVVLLPGQVIQTGIVQLNIIYEWIIELNWLIL